MVFIANLIYIHALSLKRKSNQVCRPLIYDSRLIVEKLSQKSNYDPLQPSFNQLFRHFKSDVILPQLSLEKYP